MYYEYSHLDKYLKGGLRKIGELSRQTDCGHPEHNPPTDIVLSPGVYEYTCPSCGRKITFTVSNTTL